MNEYPCSSPKMQVPLDTQSLFLLSYLHDDLCFIPPNQPPTAPSSPSAAFSAALLTWAASQNVGSELPVLGYLQAQAVYAPEGVRKGRTRISDGGVVQSLPSNKPPACLRSQGNGFLHQ